MKICQVIHVGDAYQAQVEATAEFDSTNEQTDDREGKIDFCLSNFWFFLLLQTFLVSVDELFWSSSSTHEISDDTIDEYLKTIHQECNRWLIIERIVNESI